MGAVLAVRVDTARGVLWTTTSGIAQMAGYMKADSQVAELLQLRIADGVIQRRWKLPVAKGGHVLGDVVDRNSALADEPTIGTMVGDEFVSVATASGRNTTTTACVARAAHAARAAWRPPSLRTVLVAAKFLLSPPHTHS